MNQAAGLDELAAGSAWRASKLKSFKERVRGTCELRPRFCAAADARPGACTRYFGRPRGAEGVAQLRRAQQLA